MSLSGEVPGDGQTVRVIGSDDGAQLRRPQLVRLNAPQQSGKGHG
jgi:hypothetical protein